MATKNIKKILLNKDGDNFVADIENIENRITQNSSNLETAKQELSNKCDTVLSDAKAYTDTEKQKYIPLTGTYDLQPGVYASQNLEANACLLIGVQKKIGINTWKTGGITVLNGGQSERKGSCQWFASRKINDLSDDDDSNFNTTSLTLTPDGALYKNLTIQGVGSEDRIIETQRIKNGPNQTCILYENGWCLQCGRVWAPKNSDFATVNLLTPFRDTDYFVFCMARDPDDNTYPAVASTNFNSKTTTSFHAVLSFPSDQPPLWHKGLETCGIDWLALGFVN